MSILIRGMEMPIKCAKCPIADISAEYYFCEKIDWFGKERPSDCPLVEIPTPHGQLGDLDALWDRMYNYIDNEGAKMPYGDNDFMIHKDSACELIEDMPTIIEAEGSKI